jgi:cytochrome P450
VGCRIDFDPDTASSSSDPYPAYRRLRDEAPVYRHEQGGEAVWVLSRFEDVNDALSDWHAFSSANSKEHRHLPPAARGSNADRQLISQDPPRHTQLRGVIKSYFTPRHVGALESTIRDHVIDRIGRLRPAAGFDVAADFAWPLTLAVISELVGIPEPDRTSVLSWYQTAEYARPAKRADDALALYTSYFDELAQDRAARPREDLMSVLMLSAARGEMEKADAILICKELFEGGVDVPANLVANAVAALADRPNQRALLAGSASDEMLRDAIEELARFDSPVHFLPRRTTVNVARHGVVVPRGSIVLLLLGSANRDERRFDDPDVLDVTRPSLRNVAFGAGVHFCIGAPLARLEARLAIPALLRALGDYTLDRPAVRPRGSVVMRAFLNLGVHPTRAAVPLAAGTRG